MGLPKSDPTTSLENPRENSSQFTVEFDDEDDSPNFTAPPQTRGQRLMLWFTKDLFVGYSIRPGLPVIKLVRFWDYIVVVLLFCVGLALALASPALLYACFLVIALATLPLLLVSLIIVRLFQFVKYGEGYKKLITFKHFIRGWLYIDAMMVFLALWIFYPIAKYVPSLKRVMVLELPFTKWVVIISIVCSFYLVSFLIYTCTHRLTRCLRIRSLNVPQAFSEIIDGLIIWWAKHEVMKRVPSFRHHEILGLLTGKWIRVSVLVLIGYNLITLFTHLTVITLRCFCQKHCPDKPPENLCHSLFQKHLHTKYVVFFANGMKLSISFIMSSLLLLLTWILYFGSRLDLKIAKVQSIWDFGVWTFVSLLICSFVWLIKTFVLLAWEVNTVYHRLDHKIFSISEQLYYLGILGYTKHDIFGLQPPKKAQDPRQVPGELGCLENGFNSFEKLLSTHLPSFLKRQNSKKQIVEKKERIKQDLIINENPTIDDLQRAIPYFLGAKKKLFHETYISDILSIFDRHQTDQSLSIWEKLTPGHDEESIHQAEKLRSILTTPRTAEYEKAARKGEEERVAKKSSNSKDGKRSDYCIFENFIKKLESIHQPNQRNSSEISFDKIQTWMERAHNQCMVLANTLSSADEVASCLNKIISWLLIGATFITWLLLTGLASTKVLFLVASPLLAASFIFGNTCKTLFEGILFVYVVHPFDVGDLCVIDDVMMEVTSIGIWTTTFTKVDKLGKQEVVIHPNVSLASKVIINHKTEFDWSDCIEYELSDQSLKNIVKHKDLIRYFKNQITNKGFDFLSSFPDLKISAKGDSTKLVIRLKYQAENSESWTYSECLRRKNKLHSKFSLFMQQVIFKEQETSLDT